MTHTRRNLMWPLVVIAVGSIWLLMTAGALPEATGDIIQRAWPALLILFGFDILFGRRRLRLWRSSIEMSLVGLMVTVVLLIGLVWLAYRHQADVVRADNVQTFSQALPEGVTHVRLKIALDRTAITANPATDPRELKAEFKGSKDSRVSMIWSVEGDTGVLSVTETHASAIPKLEDYGRGTLNLTLPAGAVIDVLDLSNKHGDVTADLQPLQVEQIAVTAGSGNLTLHLPAQDVLQGKLKTGDGGIELFVPQSMALVLKAQGSGEPDYRYDTFRYDLLKDGTLKRRNTEAFQISLDVWLKGGAPLTVTDLP